MAHIPGLEYDSVQQTFSGYFFLRYRQHLLTKVQEHYLAVLPCFPGGQNTACPGSGPAIQHLVSFAYCMLDKIFSAFLVGRSRDEFVLDIITAGNAPVDPF